MAASVMVYSYKRFEDVVAILRDPTDYCEVIRYSPSEEMLALGCHDFSILVYEASQEEDGFYVLHFLVNDRHTAPITGLDWSCDSIHIRVIDQHYYKSFYNVEKGR